MIIELISKRTIKVNYILSNKKIFFIKIEINLIKRVKTNKKLINHF